MTGGGRAFQPSPQAATQPTLGTHKRAEQSPSSAEPHCLGQQMAHCGGER